MQNACDTGKELIERMQLLTVVNDSKVSHHAHLTHLDSACDENLVS